MAPDDPWSLRRPKQQYMRNMSDIQDKHSHQYKKKERVAIRYDFWVNNLLKIFIL